MNSTLITLAAKHDWQTGLQINDAVRWLNKANPLESVVLMKHGYIAEIPKVVGYEWRLTAKGVEWLITNNILKFGYRCPQYNIFVRDVHPSKPMIRYFIEHFDNETDEWVEQKSFSYLVEWLGLTDGFDSKTEIAYVFNPLAVFEGDARKGIDYIIVGGN